MLQLYNSICQFPNTSSSKSNLYALIENLRILEQHKFKEYTESVEKCKGNKTMLYEYNYKGLNSYYPINALPMTEWIEELLRNGEVLGSGVGEPSRLSDLILKEIGREKE